MASTASVDAAVIATLANDATLTSLAPGGVYREVAPQGISNPYVIISPMSHQDEYSIGSQAFEELRYLVKGVDLSTSGSTVQTVANRIHVLLQNAVLTITDYKCLLVQREERIAYVEVDDDSDRRYQHRGGLYFVLVEPT